MDAKIIEKYREAFEAIMSRRHLYEGETDEVLSSLWNIEFDDVAEEIINSIDEKDFEEYGLFYNEEANEIEYSDLFYDLFYTGQDKEEEDIKEARGLRISKVRY